MFASHDEASAGEPNQSREIDDAGRYDLTVLDVLAGADTGEHYVLPDGVLSRVKHSWAGLARQLRAGEISADARAALAVETSSLQPAVGETERREVAQAIGKRLDDNQALALINAALGHLDETERTVITMKFGLAPHSSIRTLRTIGEYLHLSPASVSRIHDEAMSKLYTIIGQQLT